MSRWKRRLVRDRAKRLAKELRTCPKCGENLVARFGRSGSLEPHWVCEGCVLNRVEIQRLSFPHHRTGHKSQATDDESPGWHDVVRAAEEDR